jgi:hypothetical protein
VSLDRRLELLLKVGTWAACALVAAGMLLAYRSIVVAGVLLLIALPVMRVVLMGWWFSIHRELRFALAAAAVLFIILLSAAWSWV